MSIKNMVVIAQLNAPTQPNNRVYTPECFTEVLGKSVLGEFNRAGLPCYSELNLSDASHEISNIHIENDQLIGEVRILETTTGKMLRQLYDAGVELKYSTVGIGNIDDKGIVSNYHLLYVNVMPEIMRRTYHGNYQQH